jgi:hypothetical protein
MGAEHSRLEDPRKAEVTKQGDIRHGSVSGATPKGVPTVSASGFAAARSVCTSSHRICNKCPARTRVSSPTANLGHLRRLAGTPTSTAPCTTSAKSHHCSAGHHLSIAREFLHCRVRRLQCSRALSDLPAQEVCVRCAQTARRRPRESWRTFP